MLELTVSHPNKKKHVPVVKAAKQGPAHCRRQAGRSKNRSVRTDRIVTSKSLVLAPGAQPELHGHPEGLDALYVTIALHIPGPGGIKLSVAISR